MGEDEPVEGNRGEPFGALEVPLLRRRQQRMQHLDRRLEHLDEFEQALVGQAQAARVAVRVGIVLRMALQLADVDLAYQRGDVLVVLVAGLRLGDRHLAKHRRPDAHDSKLRQVPAVLLEALQRPRRHDAGEVAARDAVVGFEDGAKALGREQSQRRLVHRRALDRVDRPRFHHHLQPLCDRRLAAADRSQQVEDLLPFLEPLRRMLEERDDLIDRILHSVEFAERGIAPDDAVAEDPREVLVVAGVDEFGLADAVEHALGRGRVGPGVALAKIEIAFEAHFLVLGGRVIGPILFQKRRHRGLPSRRCSKMPVALVVPSARGIPGGSPFGCVLKTPVGIAARAVSRQHKGRAGVTGPKCRHAVTAPRMSRCLPPPDHRCVCNLGAHHA